MSEEIVCTVCGNEVDPKLTRCPFCNEPRSSLYRRDTIEQFLIINLEHGMPFVRDAQKRLELELEAAQRKGLRALVLIHGYGSSGKGGAIKDAVRRQLQSCQDRKKVSDVLPGEECSKRSGHARQVMKRFPFLEKFLQRPNPGITLVII